MLQNYLNNVIMFHDYCIKSVVPGENELSLCFSDDSILRITLLCLASMMYNCIEYKKLF